MSRGSDGGIDMKSLLVLDSKNYDASMPVIEKYSVRALICKNGQYAMQLSGKGEYKLPGGCVEAGEDFIEALGREIQEEVGLVMIPDSVREIGEITEMRLDVFDSGKKYVCHSLFYHVDVEDRTVPTNMTDSEIAKGFHPVWADLDTMIEKNNALLKEAWQKRDTTFLEMVKNGSI